MADSSINLQADRTVVYKGFVQFSDPDMPADFLRLKERQVMTANYNFIRAEHYSDTGIKAKDANGHNHTFSLETKITPDLFDTETDWGAMAPADQSTISYWIYQSMPPQNNPIQITFMVTNANQAGDLVVQKFSMMPDSFRVESRHGQGTDVLIISGEILAITSLYTV